MITDLIINNNIRRCKVTLFLFLFITVLGYGQKDSTISIYFESGKFGLDSVARLKLSTAINQGAIIKSISGHADTVGSNRSNHVLSKNRSFSVARYLRNQLRLRMNFPILYFGEEQPISASNNALNRRVDILLYLPNLSLPNTNQLRADSNLSTPIKIYSFDNIFFIPDKPIIESYSMPQVDEIARILKSHLNDSIEIRGHVNVPLWSSGRKDTAYMKKMEQLSNDRASTIYEILVEKGIPSEIMIYKGMGNTEMLLPNARTESEKRKNMRVEILIYNSNKKRSNDRNH